MYQVMHLNVMVEAYTTEGEVVVLKIPVKMKELTPFHKAAETAGKAAVAMMETFDCKIREAYYDKWVNDDTRRRMHHYVQNWN